jgi:hypothetical protein
VPDQADHSELTPPAHNPRHDRRRRDWSGCWLPLLWAAGTLGSTVLGCMLGAAYFKQTHGEPNPGLFNEMRLYYEMITNGGLIGAGLGASGGAVLWLLLSFLGKDARSG